MISPVSKPQRKPPGTLGGAHAPSTDPHVPRAVEQFRCQKVPRLTQLQPGYCALVGTDTSGPQRVCADRSVADTIVHARCVDDGARQAASFHATGDAVEAGLQAPTRGIPVDTTGDGKANAIGFDTNGDGRINALDTTGDGNIDTLLQA